MLETITIIVSLIGAMYLFMKPIQDQVSNHIPSNFKELKDEIRAVNQRIDNLSTDINQRIDNLSTDINQRFDKIYELMLQDRKGDKGD